MQAFTKIRRSVRLWTSGLLGRQRGQSLVEYTLVLPMVLLFLAVAIQLSLVVIQYYSVMHITRETARWVSINADTFDSAVSTYANNLRTSLPGVNNSAFTSVVTSPSCTALVNSHCPSRGPGETVSVTITVDVSSVLFLPSSYQIFNWRFAFPTTMPAYRVTAMLE